MSEDRDSLVSWAQALYRQPGVMVTLLTLQDECGADVLLLLASAWLWKQGLGVPAFAWPTLVAQQQPWHEEIIQPLRQVRRTLKRQDGVDTLYQQVKAVELEAELLQLGRLQRWALTLSKPVSGTLLAQLGLLMAVGGGLDQGERLHVLLDQYAAAVARFSSQKV